MNKPPPDNVPDGLDNYFQCVENDGRWEFQVGGVTWPHPHTPELIWHCYRRWMTAPNPARIAKARAAAIRKRRFFGTCTLCGELNNAGHMHDRETCQGCAERFLCVVH